jgi:hypothetical protein
MLEDTSASSVEAKGLPGLGFSDGISPQHRLLIDGNIPPDSHNVQLYTYVESTIDSMCSVS